jgi:outer membrane immunogenic protein
MKRLAVISILLIASSLSVFGGIEETVASTSRDDSWTGFYLGGKIGYGAISNGTGLYDYYTNKKLDSLIGGGEVGYDYQFHPHWLVGAVADFSGADLSKGLSGSGFSPFPGQPEISFRREQSIDWFGTARGKIGCVFARKFLVFGTGGFAYADVENDFSYTFLFINRPGASTSSNTIDNGLVRRRWLDVCAH